MRRRYYAAPRTATPTRSSTSSRADISNRRCVTVTARSTATAPGYLFAAPYAGHGPAGPMIFDEAGNARLVPPAAERRSKRANLQVQQLDGKPRAHVVAGLHRAAGLRRGRRGHRRLLLPRRSAVCARATATSPTCTTSTSAPGHGVADGVQPDRLRPLAVRRPGLGAVTDSLFQEVDLHDRPRPARVAQPRPRPLGRLLQLRRRGPSLEWPFDYFHLNSIEQAPSGQHAALGPQHVGALRTEHRHGPDVSTTIGGRHSNVQARPRRRRPPTSTTRPAAGRQDRDLRQRRRAEGPPAVAGDDRVARMPAPAPTASSRSTSTPMPPLVGQPGQRAGARQRRPVRRLGPAALLLGVQPVRRSCCSTRTCTAPTSPTAPTASPGRALPLRTAGARRLRAGAGGSFSAYASWNGDTRTAPWRLLGGPDQRRARPRRARTARRALRARSPPPAPQAYVAVQALDAAGNVLGISPDDPRLTPPRGALGLGLGGQRSPVQPAGRALACVPPVSLTTSIAPPMMPSLKRRGVVQARAAARRAPPPARKSHSGSQPSAGFHTSRRSAGTVLLDLRRSSVPSRRQPLVGARVAGAARRAVVPGHATHQVRVAAPQRIERPPRASDMWWITESPWKMPHTVWYMLRAHSGSASRTLSRIFASG